MSSESSAMSGIVAIIAIVAIAFVAYFAYERMTNANTDGGNAVIEVDLPDGGGNGGTDSN